MVPETSSGGSGSGGGSKTFSATGTGAGTSSDGENTSSATNGKSSFTGATGSIPGTGQQNPTEKFVSNIQEVSGSQNLISGHVSFDVMTSGGAPGGKPWSVTSIVWSASGTPVMYASQAVPNPSAGQNLFVNTAYNIGAE